MSGPLFPAHWSVEKTIMAYWLIIGGAAIVMATPVVVFMVLIWPR